MSLLVLVVGFLISAVEVRFLHREAVREEAVAWIPTISSVVGMVACCVALLKSRKAAVVATVALLCVAISGGVGLYFHTKFQPAAFMALFQGSSTAKAGEPAGSGSSETRESEEGATENFEQAMQEVESEGSAPALAPLSLAGLALLGMLAATDRRSGTS